jgi:hypothetical protein
VFFALGFAREALGLVFSSFSLPLPDFLSVLLTCPLEGLIFFGL